MGARGGGDEVANRKENIIKERKYGSRGGGEEMMKEGRKERGGGN